MLERFTDEARHVVADARSEAVRLDHGHIGTEHLLLAILRSNAKAADVFRRHGIDAAGVERDIVSCVEIRGAGSDRVSLAAIGIDLDAVDAALAAAFGDDAIALVRDERSRRRRHTPRRIGRARGRSTEASERPATLRFDAPAKKVLELGLRESLRLGHGGITTEHLALGMLRGGDGLARLVLLRHGVSFPALRVELEAAGAS